MSDPSAIRGQDIAFLLVVGCLAACGGALFVGQFVWASTFGAAIIVIAVVGCGYARRHPSPMSHTFRSVLLLPRWPHTAKHLIEILEPRPGERLLEVGPGIGVHTLPIAQAIEPGGIVDAIDIQSAMIRDLRARATRMGVTNIETATGDATSLPYHEATFDGAFLISVLGEVPDQDAALAELRRVIKPGGRLVIGEMLIDPDFIPGRRLRQRTQQAGFTFVGRQGLPFAYLARFETTDAAGVAS